ncbi:MAG: MIP/aquaporin family protein [Acidobacteriota bacterium]
MSTSVALRRSAAEGLGTLLLVATVVGSGIMAERLAGGNVALALLCNSLATGLGLATFILALAPLTGAHFNPAVTLAVAAHGGLPWPEVPLYIVGQLGGAFAGVATAHAMFEMPLFIASDHARHGGGQLLGEFVATFGLVFLILACAKYRSIPVTAAAVGAYIASAYWFTSSTSFANPAVTLARAASDTFAGIRFADVLPFVGAQLLGAFAGAVALRLLRFGAASSRSNATPFAGVSWGLGCSCCEGQERSFGALPIGQRGLQRGLNHPQEKFIDLAREKEALALEPPVQDQDEG